MRSVPPARRWLDRGWELLAAVASVKRCRCCWLLTAPRSMPPPRPSSRSSGAMIEMMTGSAPNEVFGRAGNDFLAGERGNDRLDGGAGFDAGTGGYHDGRIDWVTSLERPDECDAPDPAPRPCLSPTVWRSESRNSRPGAAERPDHQSGGRGVTLQARQRSMTPLGALVRSGQAGLGPTYEGWIRSAPRR